MFVTNWISTTKIQKISEITNFFRHYFLSRTEVFTTPYTCNNTGSPSFDNTISSLLTIYKPLRQLPVIEYFDNGFFSVSAFLARSAMDWAWLTIGSNANMMMYNTLLITKKCLIIICITVVVVNKSVVVSYHSNGYGWTCRNYTFVK